MFQCVKFSWKKNIVRILLIPYGSSIIFSRADNQLKEWNYHKFTEFRMETFIDIIL